MTGLAVAELKHLEHHMLQVRWCGSRLAFCMPRMKKCVSSFGRHPSFTVATGPDSPSEWLPRER